MALVSSLAKGLRKSPRESLDPVGPPAPTGYAGTLPSTIAELNGWTLASIWDFAHNFKDITGSPNTVDAMTGSSSFQLARLGSSQATVISEPQSGYADQSGITISTSSQTLYKASLNWSHHATIPTVYLCTFRFESAPVTKSPKFLGGLAGDGINGFYVQAHATSGIRVGIGNGTSGYVNTNYIGGTDFYDGEWHTLALCIDDAAGKVKLACGAYSTESTGLTIYTPVSVFCTVGATYDGDPDWEPGVSYLLIARGQHPLAYTNFETALNEYEDARLNNVNQTAIAGLPASLSELNDASGFTFTDGVNFSSLTPTSFSTTYTLSSYTGSMSGATGTAPTLASAPQVRASFTSQAAVEIDSVGDNLWATGLMPEVGFTMVLIYKMPATHSGSSDVILGINTSTTAKRPYSIETSASNTVRLQAYDSYSGTLRTAACVSTGIAQGSAWRTIVIRRANSGGTNAIKVDGVATGVSGTVTQSQSALTEEGGFGRLKDSPFNQKPVLGSFALWGVSTTIASDAEITAISNGLRWRYGL